MDQVEGTRGQATDRDLFRAAQAGDYTAFEEIVRRYHERVFRLAFGMTKSESDAEEIVQDTFLNVFRNIKSYRADAAPGSWIYRVAANSALMRLRTKRRKPLLSIEDMPASENGQSGLWPVGAWARQPDEKLLNQELMGRLDEAISRLPEKYRLVLLLRDVEGLDNDEVAETLGLTVPTVKARLHRSRMFVRDEIDRYFRQK